MLIPAGMLIGIAATSLILGRGGEAGPRRAPAAPDTVVTAEGDTLSAAAVPSEVAQFLANGQYWRAARAMRAHLSSRGSADPEIVLIAARAEAGWGGWARAREYLEGRSWLSEVSSGEGWFWLARAFEETDAPAEAMRAYAEYLRASEGSGGADRRTVAELRRGLILLRNGSAEEGAILLEGTRAAAPEITPWVNLLAAEALAETGDTARVRALLSRVDDSELWLRSRRALVKAYDEAGDFPRVQVLAREYARQAGSAGAKAELSLMAAEAGLAAGDTAAAREDLRAVLSASPGSGSARTAADLLTRTGRLGAADRLAVATTLDRTGAKARAAADYRAWLDMNTGSAADRAGVRLRLAGALFDAGEYANAITAVRPLADASGSTGARAMFLIGRAEYRRGNTDRAYATWLDLASRHPGTVAGSDGLFLVGDLNHDDGNFDYAKRIYRRVADEFRGTDRAGLSLMRLGGIEYQAGNWAAAAAAWQDYTSTYPSGERWLQASYWAARARENAGEAESARALYQAVRQREPLSYYALRSAERLDQPFWPVPLSTSPGDDGAARARVDRWMRGIDLLQAAGLHAEAEAEADRWIRTAGDDRAMLYPLAEALNERGLTVRGIRIGLRLQNEASQPNERLLRIVYPFPYRAMVVAEATEKGLDPFLVSALTRQESLFKARISSPVGARGLMQIMPATGEVLARSARIDGWDDELLYQPEINVHLGTAYLAEQMDRYDESLPAVFSAYNAGPHRIDRWKRLFPEWGDEQLFTERIPYRETRDYVKILTRNIAVYRALYE